MARIDELLEKALKSLPPKPEDTASRAGKKRYSERISAAVALALAAELRERGLAGCLPGGGKETAQSGTERRMAGGLGAKKVDVTWSTEEAGLLLAISVKTINFRDQRTGNFQKNLINRRGDMLMEAVTLHRRFPYAVLCGLFFLDKDAARDGTPRRKATFLNAHQRLQLFTDRNDPAGREEQFERLYLLLLDASPKRVSVRMYRVGEPDRPISVAAALDEVLMLVAQRSSDLYEFDKGSLRPAA
jgi:hypothetical protein